MMNLGDDRIGPFWDTIDIVEPFNDRELPRRAGKVERAGKDPRRQNTKLPPVAWLRERDVPDVVFQIEIGVADPLRIIDAKGHFDQLLSKRF